MKKEHAKKFLGDFKQKLRVFGVIYRNDRNKNLQTLADLEIGPNQRTEYLLKLKVENYISGPNKDTLYSDMPDYWEFGAKVKNKDVYTKISMGKPNNQVICISFHIAEYKMNYVFKSEGE